MKFDPESARKVAMKNELEKKNTIAEKEVATNKKRRREDMNV
jgi:hypothetical protein